MKKNFALLLAAAMMFNLTACGNDDDDDEDSSSRKRSTRHTTSASSDEEETTEKTTKKKKTTEPSTEKSTKDKNKDKNKEPSTEPGGKQIIDLWAFTDEVPLMVRTYVSLHPEFAEKYEIKETIIATNGGSYENALDTALDYGENDAPDIYCVESEFAYKYIKGESAGYAASYSDIGISDLSGKLKSAEIAPYSVEIGTNNNGDVVGLGYQSCSGAFIYRRSIAKDVFGSDDPSTIEAEIGAGTGSWDSFLDAAKKLDSKGYAIVSGSDDVWHSLSGGAQRGWIVNNRLNIDPKREQFLDISKALTDNGYTNGTTTWDIAWFDNMKGENDKQVFGYFGPSWFISYVLSDNCTSFGSENGTYGDWAVCLPPEGYYQGGTWLLANNESKCKEGIAELIEWITLDSSENGLQYMWASGLLDGQRGTKDAVTSNAVMRNIDGSCEVLGGQNMFDVFISANELASGKNISPYDENIGAMWCEQASDYANGTKSREDAIDYFKNFVEDRYGLTE